MLKTLTVMGQTQTLNTVQSRKMYATVAVRAADLVTDAGTYVACLVIDSTTDDYARAVRDLRHVDLGPAMVSLVVRIEDSRVIL
jgi:hypothetical protein